MGFPDGLSSEESACNAGDTGDMGSVLGLGRFPWRRARQPTLAFLPENPMDREAWRATVHEVTKSQTWLQWLSMHAFHCLGPGFQISYFVLYPWSSPWSTSKVWPWIYYLFILVKIRGVFPSRCRIQSPSDFPEQRADDDLPVHQLAIVA